jgi:hypothetical protein
MESASSAITERVPTLVSLTLDDGPAGPGQSRSAHAVAQGRLALAVLGFGLPVASYFWLIAHYGVNTIYADQWYNVALVGHHLNFSALWAQHAEHRMLVPNVIVVLLAHTTHLNIVFEECLNGLTYSVVRSDSSSWPTGGYTVRRPGSSTARWRSEGFRRRP